MLTIHKPEENVIHFNYAGPKHHDEFVAAVLYSYKDYVQTLTAPVIPTSFTAYDDGVFYETFYEPYIIAQKAMAFNEYGKELNDLTEDEFEEMDEDITSHWWNIEYNLFEDITAVLNAHQLFHIPSYIEVDERRREVVTIDEVDISNCPLQEVW